MNPQLQFRALLWVVPLTVLVVATYRHGLIISFPYQLEYREGATPLFTQFMIDGGSIYELGAQPVHVNVYGIGYNLLVYPFAKLFGVTIQLHRVVSAVAIAATCLLVFYASLRNGSQRLLAFTAAVLLYIELQYYVIPLARPDAVGLLLYVLTIFIPAWRRFSMPSLAFSLLLAALALMTKLYFVFGLLIVIAHVYLFESQRKGLVLFAVAVVAFTALSLTVSTSFGTYVHDVLMTQQSHRTYSIQHMMLQWQEFLLWHVEWLVIAAIVLVTVIWKGVTARFLRSASINRINPLAIEPLFRNGLSIYATALGLGVAAIVYPLGGHGGNWMVYLIQLVTPFFLIVLSSLLTNVACNRYTEFHKVGLLVVLLGFSMLARNLHSMPRPPDAQTASVYRVLEGYLMKHESAYVSPALVWSARVNGHEIYNSGQTEYFFTPVDLTDNKVPEIVRQSHIRFRDHYLNLMDRIRKGQFDLLILETGSSRSMNPLLPGVIPDDYILASNGVLLDMPHSRQQISLGIWRKK